MNTTSLEMSKRLKEAGVDKEPTFAWCRMHEGWAWDLIYKGVGFTLEEWERLEKIPAYTIAELLELLPAQIINKKQIYFLTIKFASTLCVCSYHRSLCDEADYKGRCWSDKNLCDALGEMVLYLKKEKII